MLVQGIPATTARVQIQFSVLGEMQLNRAIAGRIRDTSDFSGPFRQVADDLVDMEQEAFAREGAYEGNPVWAPLKDRYARWKAKHYPGKKILERTGRLLRLMTSPNIIIRPLSLVMEFLGYRVGRWDLPALHQTGRKNDVMKARKPLNLSMRRRRRWLRFFRKHLQIEGQVSP